MKKFIIVILSWICSFASAQSLQEINYNYQYYPEHDFFFHLKPVKSRNSWTVFYEFRIRDTTRRMVEFSIQWQGRETISVKEGTVLSLTPTDHEKDKSLWTGSFTLAFSEAPKILVAKVINSSMKRAWLFYTRLDADHPVNGALSTGTSVWLKKYIHSSKNVSITGDTGSWIVSYYNDDFPAAPPGFSEKQAKVERSFIADSTFNVEGGTPFNFFAKGLYLFQKDTLSINGFSIRAETDYPKYTSSQNLAGPFIYICTKEEYNRLEQAKGNKKTFDRTVLAITGDVNRAKNLIRNYFRRVELANEFFTSYKEGWKTDRGMIYIIFGFPDEVFKFDNREVWTYNTEPRKISFSFIRAASVFDPDNYVLIRDDKYTQKWYEVVDLWRNARY